MGEKKMEIDPKITANRQRTIAQNRCYRGHTKHAYSDEFYTPPEIPAALGTFDVDHAGPSEHARRNICRPKDGLLAIWRGRVWLNPPYSRLEDWLTRFVDHGNGIALVNAAPTPYGFSRSFPAHRPCSFCAVASTSAGPIFHPPRRPLAACW